MKVLFRAYDGAKGCIFEQVTIGSPGLIFNITWARNNGYSFTTQLHQE